MTSADPSVGVGDGKETPSPLSVSLSFDMTSDAHKESSPDLFLVAAFHKADIDGDGKLSYEELKDLLQSVGLEEDEEKLNKIVYAVDTDKNGTIDLAEFQSIIDSMKTKTTVTFEQQLRQTFELYDADGSGSIDRDELAHLMATLGYDLTDEELSAMIDEVDANGNGGIEYEEFQSLMFKGKGVHVAGDEKHQKQDGDVVLKKLSRKNSILGQSIFDDAKQLISFGRVFRFVTWLYSERKLILLACSHFVATLVIWGHFALIKFQQQEDNVPEGAPRYWAKRLVPPIEFGSMHAILFQMALIPFTMSRYTIATFSNSKLNKYLPLDKALRIHIHLGYTMVSIVFSATIVFFIFFGLSCSEGEQAFCDKFTSEIMITGYCILGLLLLMAGTAFFRHSIPYELFYGVHFLFLAMYAIAVVHTFDVAQRSGKKDRSQTFKWFAAPLIYYLCDYAMMWVNQRFKTLVTSFTTVEGREGSKMLILKVKRPTLFIFQPGQYAFLQVESIDRTWHPFSIASDPDSNTMEFYIEVFGELSWTERFWTELQKKDKHQKMFINLLGPYGTALVKDSSYTNIIAIGTGTGIVPCTSLLKQHVRKMVTMDPTHYFTEHFEQKKRNTGIIGAKEVKHGSLVSHLASGLKRLLAFKEHGDVEDVLRIKSARSLKSHMMRQTIRSSMIALNKDVQSHHNHNPSLRNKAKQKIATFNATKLMYAKTILTVFTLYSVTIFSLTLSWNVTTADISSDMLNVLDIMTFLLHAIFFLCSFFIWNGASLQSYFDAAISIILPFADWHYKLQSSLSTGQVITLSFLNGYIAFRFYQKTLDTVTVAQNTLKESVEHLRFIWSVRTVKMARQILPEINETYELLMKEWGEDYARDVLDITICITEKDRSEAASFRAQFHDCALFKNRKVVFIRPKIGQIVEEHVLNLIERHPAYSSTLLVFCGGPKISGLIAKACSTIELLAAATGYSSHQLDFVSESYGGAKPKSSSSEEVSKKKGSSEAFWDEVKQEQIRVLNTKRVKTVFEYDDEDEDEEEADRSVLLKEYKSKRDLLREYSYKRGSTLRYRSNV